METSAVMNKPSAKELGLNGMRARARANRTQVRLQRTEPANEMNVRASMQKIRTLKNISADDLPDDPTEPTLLGRIWGKFQQLLGNR